MLVGVIHVAVLVLLAVVDRGMKYVLGMAV